MAHHLNEFERICDWRPKEKEIIKQAKESSIVGGNLQFKGT